LNGNYTGLPPGFETDTLPLLVDPYSLGILIEWKLRLNRLVMSVGFCYPYSLGILIEWKLQLLSAGDLETVKSLLARDIN